MQRKIRLAVLTATLSALSACVAVPGAMMVAPLASPGPALSLYPVSGPMFDRSPRPVLHGSSGGILTAGAVTVVTDNQSKCTGEWHVVKKESSNGNYAPGGLEHGWDAVYGKGHFQAEVLGEPRHAAAILHCTDGSALTVEVNARRAQPERNYGVAEDSSGNVFKVVYN